MERCTEHFLALTAGALLLLLSAAPPAGAQVNTPYAVWGRIQNADGSAPAAAGISFAAHIVGRPGEVLRADDPGTFVGDPTAAGLEYQLELGNFATQWAAGDELMLVATNTLLDPKQMYRASIVLGGSETEHNFVLAVPAVLVTGTDTQTGEDGDTGALSVRLSVRPEGNIDVTCTSADQTEGKVATPTTLQFTPENWSIPQFVEIIGQDDSLQDGDIEYHIDIVATSTAVGVDPEYRGYATAVTLTNVDDGELYARFRLVEDGYLPDQEVNVDCEFGYPLGRATLAALTWTFELPQDWTITNVTGDGDPSESVATPGTIVFGQDPALMPPPVGFRVTLKAPADATGTYTLGGIATYAFADDPNPEPIRALPDPLVLAPPTVEQTFDFVTARINHFSTFVDVGSTAPGDFFGAFKEKILFTRDTDGAVWVPAGAIGNPFDLGTMAVNPGDGYELMLRADIGDQSVTVDGTEIDYTQKIVFLRAGRINLVGYPKSANSAVVDVIPGQVLGKILFIRESNSGDVYIPIQAIGNPAPIDQIGLMTMGEAYEIFLRGGEPDTNFIYQ